MLATLLLLTVKALDETFPQVYNDSFMKLYLTAPIKRHWGANMMKFVEPDQGGIELNGRQYYDDAEKNLRTSSQECLMSRTSSRLY